MENKKPIRSFTDLIVYQNLYQSMLLVMTQVAPKLPKEEKYDLADQLRRASKSAPAQLAEAMPRKTMKKVGKSILKMPLVSAMK